MNHYPDSTQLIAALENARNVLLTAADTIDRNRHQLWCPEWSYTLPIELRAAAHRAQKALP